MAAINLMPATPFQGISCCRIDPAWEAQQAIERKKIENDYSKEKLKKFLISKKLKLYAETCGKFCAKSCWFFMRGDEDTDKCGVFGEHCERTYGFNLRNSRCLKTLKT